jgi:putative ABC transport system permease protein
MGLFSDFRHAARHLRQSPGYALAAALTLAVAIGANGAIFSAVNAVLLRPLPVDAPDRLAVVWQTDKAGQAVIELTYRHLREWTEAGSTFTKAAVMGSHNWSAVLQGRGEPSRIWFAGVSAGFFDTLGVRPLLGRGFRAEDDVPNGPAIAVLNHAAWVRRFGADPGIVGTRMILDGGPVEIVGVMPSGVDFPRGAEFWAPIVPALATGTPPNAALLDTLGVFYVVGRLHPSLAMTGVRAGVDATEARLDLAKPGRLKWGTTAVVTPFVDYVFGPVRPALRVLWSAVMVLLLIACANVSGLMLTRVATRRQEHSIRLALGATRLAVARAWIAEVLLVALAGGALGLTMAHWMAKAIVALAPDDLPRVADIAVDTPVALFTFGIVICAAVITVAVPLKQAGRASLLDLVEGERTTSGRAAMRTRSALLVAQIALSVVLLVAAGLVLRSFLALSRVDLGFSPDRVLSVTVRPQGTPLPPNVWLDGFLQRVRALPGVESAGAVYLRPLMLGPIGQGVAVRLEGQPEVPAGNNPNPVLNHQIATPGYFETLRIPLRAGRFFTDRDTRESPRVAIVGESTARRLWAGQDPIGKRLSMSSFTPGGPRTMWRTVVGVVSDVRYRGLEEAQLDIYDAALQTGRPADNVVVRTAGDPNLAAAAVRAAARQLDPASTVDTVTTLDAVVERAAAPRRLTMWLFVVFAGLAFGLAALGLFSVVALDVTHRAREFAIRMALGAPRRTILRDVLARAGARVGGGLALGLMAAGVASHSLRGLLFGIAPWDAATYAAVLVVVLVAVTIAAYLPARRAGRAEPQALLRH